MAKVETIIFNGIKFRRYPESESRTDRLYYKPAGNHIRRGINNLHREIWKDHYGDIPEGGHIHHKDGDTLNNDIENLECVPEHEHLSGHSKEHSPGPDHMERIRPLATEWHRSNEGRAWHREHGGRVYRNRKPREFTCDFCGCEFESKDYRGGKRYCTGKCRAAARRREGADDETKTCPVCEEEYRTNKYKPTKTCSRKCGADLRRKR